jgi:hypothetical protein
MIYTKFIGNSIRSSFIFLILVMVSIEGFHFTMRFQSTSTPCWSMPTIKKEITPIDATTTNLQRKEEMEDTIIRLDRTPSQQRRSLLRSSLALMMVTTAITTDSSSMAFVGSLPEWENTNTILQGLTIRVTDPSQRQQMIAFLQEGFDMQILRQSADQLDTVRKYNCMYACRCIHAEANKFRLSHRHQIYAHI